MWKIIKKIGFIKKKLKSLNPDLGYVISKLMDVNKILIFIDVGANTGQTIDLALSHYPNAEIFSFEPTPVLFDELEIKYRNNRKVNLYKMALSDRNGEHSFFISDYSPTNSILKPNISLYSSFGHRLTSILNECKEIKIWAQRFDEWYDRNLKDRIIDIMKIDTQGFDFNVINGGVKSISNYVKILVVELQFQEFYEAAKPFYKIAEILYNCGFYLLSFVEINKINNLQYIECNAIFLNSNFFKSCFLENKD